MIELRPMTAAELHDYLERSIPDYVADHVRAGRWRPEEALAKSRAEHDELLPKGIDSPNQFLRVVIDSETKVRVGELWYEVRSTVARPQVFVYWLGIDPEHRRKGYASEVLRLVETEARKLGADRVGLHVFGENLGARALYEKMGFVPTNVLMAKPLS